MKTTTRFSLLVLSTFFIISVFSCADKCEELREFVEYEPVYIDQAEYEKAVTLDAPQDVINAGVIATYGQHLFVNEYNRGIHIINNSDPANPVNEGFISINNNKHFAIKDGIVLANRYNDLVAVNIRNVNAIQEVQRISNVFPDESQVTPQGIIAYYNRTSKITTQTCEQPFWGDFWFDEDVFMVSATEVMPQTMNTSDARALSAGQTVGTSTSSSSARFTIAKDFLYVLNSWSLEVFDISNPSAPNRQNQIGVGTNGNPETLFPLNDYLFIGANSGMGIYDLSNPGNPQHISNFSHSTSCDPVVANEEFAYVTLRSGQRCNGFTNQLDILDIRNINNPTLMSSVELDNPRGLTIIGNHVLVCDGKEGVVIFNVADPRNAQLVGRFPDQQANDILPISNAVVAVSGDNGIFQLDVSDLAAPTLLSFVSTK
jgi:hypothetical protein